MLITGIILLCFGTGRVLGRRLYYKKNWGKKTLCNYHIEQASNVFMGTRPCSGFIIKTTK